MIRIYDTWASYRLEIGWRRWRLTIDYWYLYGEGLKVRWLSNVGTVKL